MKHKGEEKGHIVIFPIKWMNCMIIKCYDLTSTFIPLSHDSEWKLSPISEAGNEYFLVCLSTEKCLKI